MPGKKAEGRYNPKSLMRPIEDNREGLLGKSDGAFVRVKTDTRFKGREKNRRLEAHQLGTRDRASIWSRHSRER